MKNEFNRNDARKSLNGHFKPLIRKRRLQGGESDDGGRRVLGYDFFRQHTALGGRVPAEAAGIHVEGGGRVRTLFEVAAA